MWRRKPLEEIRLESTWGMCESSLWPQLDLFPLFSGEISDDERTYAVKSWTWGHSDKKRTASSHGSGVLITMCLQRARMLSVGIPISTPFGGLNSRSVSTILRYRNGVMIGCSFRERQRKLWNHASSGWCSSDHSCFSIY